MHTNGNACGHTYSDSSSSKEINVRANLSKGTSKYAY